MAHRRSPPGQTELGSADAHATQLARPQPCGCRARRDPRMPGVHPPTYRPLCIVHRACATGAHPIFISAAYSIDRAAAGTAHSAHTTVDQGEGGKRLPGGTTRLGHGLAQVHGSGCAHWSTHMSSPEFHHSPSCAPVAHTHATIRTNTHRRTHARTHAHAQAHTRARAQTHTYTHTHRHTDTRTHCNGYLADSMAHSEPSRAAGAARLRARHRPPRPAAKRACARQSG